MKIAIIGQQDFGKAVLEAFMARGDTVAGVFVAPEKEGGKPAPMKFAPREKGLRLFQFPPLRSPEEETDMPDNARRGNVQFHRLFPMGVKAMLEAADLVVAGKHKEAVQDESQATYEGWFRANEAKIHWHHHVDFIHNLIRGADPAPGAWTTINGKKLQLFGSRKHPVRTFGAVKGKIGEITGIGPESMRITAQGGQIEEPKLNGEETKKLSPAEWAKSANVSAGTILGS